MVALFRLFLIGLLIYLVFRFIARMLFPFLFIKTNQNQEKNTSERKEGEITVEKFNQSKSKGHNDNSEEYIDYEEVD